MYETVSGCITNMYVYSASQIISCLHSIGEVWGNESVNCHLQKECAST